MSYTFFLLPYPWDCHYGHQPGSCLVRVAQVGKIYERRRFFLGLKKAPSPEARRYRSDDFYSDYTRLGVIGQRWGAIFIPAESTPAFRHGECAGQVYYWGTIRSQKWKDALYPQGVLFEIRTARAHAQSQN